MSNHDNKVAFIRVDEDGAPARSYEFMKTFYNMNIIVQTTGGYSSSLNGKVKIPNKTCSNITRDILLKSSHNKEVWCFAYQYAICISRQTDNRLRGDILFFLWHGRRPSYKHIKIWGLRVYIINGCVTRNKIDDR